jgi:hypothetical protein
MAKEMFFDSPIDLIHKKECSLDEFCKEFIDDIDIEKFIKKEIEADYVVVSLDECIDVALRALGKEKTKGDFGYSFTQHITSSTKPDQKLIRELFYKDVEKAIREAHVCPEHITFTLSASSSLLKEGEDMPDYFTTTSKSRATFRKPRHVDNTPDEFTENDFQ